MDDVTERIRRELDHLEPSPGGFEKTLRRANRRDRNRRLTAAGLSLMLTAGLAVGLWLSFERPQSQVGTPTSPTPNVAPEGPRLFLAGDGEMWIVDVGTASVRNIRLSELSPGDPPYRIVRRGDKLVLWGYKTYVLDPHADAPAQVLVRDSWIFIPSAAPQRVWVGILDPSSPETVRALSAVREVSVDGRITVPATKPPDGLWPIAAVDNGLIFERGGGLEVWNPATGRVVRRIAGHFPFAAHRNLLAWCARTCDTLHITDLSTGGDVEVTAPPGTEGFGEVHGMFSPDGKTIAVTARTDPAPTSLKWQLALVDVETGTAKPIEGASTQGAYVFIDWAPSGQQIFMSGEDQSGARTLFEYEVGSDHATRLPIKVGNFYGMAVA